MANTTFSGPVTSLNGFIGGPNPNAGDTQQGGTNTWSVTDANTVTNGTDSLEAAIAHRQNTIEGSAPEVSVAT